MENKIQKTVIPPCARYDIENTRAWLSDMAKEGWLLKKDGFSFGLATFEKSEPVCARYSLQASILQAGPFDQNSGSAPREQILLNAEYGWEYIARRDQFYIYRSTDTDSIEPDNDPRVQAIAVKEVEKRVLASILPMVLVLAVNFLTNSSYGLSPAIMCAQLGLGIPVRFVVAIIIQAACILHEANTLRVLRKKLSHGYELKKDADWQKKKTNTRMWQIVRIVPFMILTAFIVILLKLPDSGKTAIDEHALSAPFSTIEDLHFGMLEEIAEYPDSYIRKTANAVLDEGIEWREVATIKQPGGYSSVAVLQVTYYDAKSVSFRQKLFSSHICLDERRFRKAGDIEKKDLSDSFEGNMEVTAFMRRDSLTELIIRKEDRVIVVSYFLRGETHYMPWIEAIVRGFDNAGISTLRQSHT